jgi:isocitrate dehydrogenase
MVYISGEEMTRYTAQLVLDKWVAPFADTSKWEFYDLSCKARDDTEDQCLRDAVSAGKRLCAIFKEPTITPTEVQKKSMGLKKAWGSPNGAMRRGWNGITISRDTIHIPGVELGFKNPVLFERQAVGGEYGAGWKKVGKGRVLTTFFPEDMKEQPVIVDGRALADEESAVVVYDNPVDGVTDLAHIFFERCLATNVVPHVVTKKTVFKWQDAFWVKMLEVFNKDWKEKFAKAGLLKTTGGELSHLISDAATMQIIRWTDGGFGMACHNYDGDMLTDEVAQVHRSPGFITSNLVGKREDGVMIKEFEASHGTVADLWHMHLAGKETSMNPLGMVVALFSAMEHAAVVDGGASKDEVFKFTEAARAAVYGAFQSGKGTRDLCGPSGLTTEQFVDTVAEDIKIRLTTGKAPTYEVKTVDKGPKVDPDLMKKVDQEKIKVFFEKYDTDKNGQIDFAEFVAMAFELGVAPLSVEYTDRMREGKAAREIS